MTPKAAWALVISFALVACGDAESAVGATEGTGGAGTTSSTASTSASATSTSTSTSATSATSASAGTTSSVASGSTSSGSALVRPCSLDAKITGGETATIDLDEAGACGSGSTGVGSDRELRLGYDSKTNQTGLGVTIRVPMASPTQLGDVAVKVTLGKGCGPQGSSCDTRWESPDGACTLSMNTHEFFEETSMFEIYRVAGPIVCTAQLADDTAKAPPVTVSELAIDTTHLWEK